MTSTTGIAGKRKSRPPQKAGSADLALLEPTAGPSFSNTPAPLYSPNPRSPARAHLPPSPIPIMALPPASSLDIESLASSELELDRQTRQLQRERDLAEALRDQQFEVDRQNAKNTSLWTLNKGSGRQRGTSSASNGPTQPFANPPQAYELYKAIDKHDLEFIMRVRDHAFHLLLQKNAGEFPIVYASRIGMTHRDIVVLLVGALSRYVNHLEDEDFEKKETKAMLRALRSNLKIAIDQSLLPASSSSNLLSSYLQVLIMSEGDSFLHRSIYDISLVVRDASPTARPVTAAEDLIRRFCTKELRGVEGGVEGVEDYVANAVIDLVMMSTWSIAATQMSVDGLPTYTFARDLRTCQMLKEAMDANRNELNKVNKRIRSILNKLVELAGDNVKGVRGRMRDIKMYMEDGG